jgi:hypothetical protein
MSVRSHAWATAIAWILLAAACSSKSSSSGGTTVVPIDPSIKGLEVLGKGTDAFGEYAVEANVKGQVLDVQSLNNAGLLVYNPKVEEYRYEEMTGHSMSTYANQLSASVGLSGEYMFFSANLKTTFTNDTYRRDDYSYASIFERHWKHAVRVEPGVWASGAMLRPYLTNLARQAIDDTDAVHGKWSGAELINSYGTHVINGLYVGARLDYHLAIQIMDEAHRSSLQAFVEAKYKNGFTSAELQANISDTTYAAMNAYRQEGPVINAKGGAAQYAHPESDAQYQQWKASIDQNPVFCGILDGGLLGIWELAPTAARRQEILAAYQAYAANEGAAFVPLVGRVTDLVVIDAGRGTGEYGEHTPPTVTPAQGYELLKSAAGDVQKANLNGALWDERVHANYVHLAIRSDVTDAPVGLAALHVASTDAATDTMLYGAAGHAGTYAPNLPGCTDAAVAGVDLNLGTTHDVVNFHDWLFCAYYVWGADAIHRPGTPLALHYTMEAPPAVTEPIRCVVVGDSAAVDYTKPAEERAQHIHWAPWDVNHDGPTGDPMVDAKWVATHVYWITDAEGYPVNMNVGTTSWALYNEYCAPWPCCWTGGCCRWDDGFAHGFQAVDDAQYLGVCYLNPPP